MARSQYLPFIKALLACKLLREWVERYNPPAGPEALLCLQGLLEFSAVAFHGVFSLLKVVSKSLPGCLGFQVLLQLSGGNESLPTTTVLIAQVNIVSVQQNLPGHLRARQHRSQSCEPFCASCEVRGAADRSNVGGCEQHGKVTLWIVGCGHKVIRGRKIFGPILFCLHCTRAKVDVLPWSRGSLCMSWFLSTSCDFPCLSETRCFLELLQQVVLVLIEVRCV
jgi:hypothetical protein